MVRIMVVAAGLVIAVAPASAPGAEDDEDGVDGKLVCGNGWTELGRPDRSVRAAPRFLVGRDGSVARGGGKGASFAVPDATEGMIARVDVATAAARVGNPVFCERIKAGTTYAFDAPAGSLATVTLFGILDGDEARLRPRRQELVDAAQRAERAALHGASELVTAVRAMREAMADPDGSSLDAASAAGKAAAAAMAKIRERHHCPTPRARMGPAICDEAQGLGLAIGALLDSLRRARAASTSQRLGLLLMERVPERVAALAAGDPPTDAQRAAQCDALARLEWYDRPELPRLVARATVPIVEDARLVVLDHRAVKRSEGGATSGTWAVLVRGVPADEKLTWTTVKGASVTMDPAQLIVTAVRVTLGAKSLLPEDLDLAERRSVLCREREAVELDPSVPPRTGVDARAFLFEPFDAGHVTEVVACEADACIGNEDAKVVRARVTLVPSRAGTFTLLTEVSFGFPLQDSDGLDFRTMARPRFEPVSGPAGPDQIYELQARTDIRNSVGTALLVGIHATDRLLIGAGPTLLLGKSGGALTQWNLRVAYRLGAGVYATLGPSVRFVPVPVDYALGDRVSVPRGPMPAAPDFRTYNDDRWQLDVGLAIDLAPLGAAAGDALKAFGGSK